MLDDQSSGDIFDDDTDRDPTYDPIGPSTSRQNIFTGDIILDSSDSDDPMSDPGHSRPVPPRSSRPRSRPSKRGRPSSNQGRQVISDSSSSEDENDERIVWRNVTQTDDMDSHQNFTFNETPGPRHIPANTTTPLDFFNLFFTQTLLNLMVLETNRYAQQFILQKGHAFSPKSKFKKWLPVSLSEVRAFIIVIMNMGLNPKAQLKNYWSTTSSQHMPWFGKMFSRSRFEMILSFFHLVDNSNLPKPNQEGYDPCKKFQPIIDHCNELFPRYYTAHQQISIDESLIGLKNHTSLMQYLPNKHHHRWGIKFWVLCDSVSKYCMKLICYKGAKSNEDKSEQKQFGLGYTVVKNLLTTCNYLKRGYHLFIDNFFSTVQLAKWLFKQETYVTGTIRRDRKHLPAEVKSKFKVGEKKYFKSNETVVMAYREKKSQRKPVVLISTNTTIEDTTVIKKRRGREITEIKPSIIADYNMFMGGIDSYDHMLYCYLNERRQMKYWKKVVFNFISRMNLNLYILYKGVCQQDQITPCSHYSFLVTIIEFVGDAWQEEQRRNHQAGGGDNIALDPECQLEKLPGKKEKTCFTCSRRGTARGRDRKRSRTVCTKCQDGCHPMCLPRHKCK